MPPPRCWIIFDSPWNVDVDFKSAVLLFDWGEMLPAIPDTRFGINIEPGMCPVCCNKLNLHESDYHALVGGNELCIFDKWAKKKIVNHSRKFHAEIILWPRVDSSQKIKGDSVSKLFLVQNLISLAGKNHDLLSFTDFKVYLAIIFGIDIGILQNRRLTHQLGSM